MKFGKNVHHRSWTYVILLRWRSWRHFMRKSDAAWWLNTKCIVLAYAAVHASSWSIVHSYSFSYNISWVLNSRPICPLYSCSCCLLRCYLTLLWVIGKFKSWFNFDHYRPPGDDLISIRLLEDLIWKHVIWFVFDLDSSTSDYSILNNIYRITHLTELDSAQ